MALKDFIVKELRFIIRCTECGVSNDTYEATPSQAARTFKVKGWTIYKGEVICKSCKEFY